jgi:hypothetical protein
MTRLEELRAKLAAGIDWREDARTMRQLLTVAEAARELAAAMKTCHICKGVVLIEEGPIHCENCTYDCEEHEPPDCVTLGVLHAKVCVALTPLLEDSEGSDANCLPTKVNTPQSDASNAAPVATQDGANLHDYLSTACFHGLHERCRRHCKFCGVDCRCPCHVKAQPAAPGRSQGEASAPGASQWLEGPQNDPGASGEGS